MSYVRKVGQKCRHCHASIRQYEAYMSFLLPKPNGEVRLVTMHGDCIVKFNRIATSKAYSDRFFRGVA